MEDHIKKSEELEALEKKKADLLISVDDIYKLKAIVHVRKEIHKYGKTGPTTVADAPRLNKTVVHIIDRG